MKGILSIVIGISIIIASTLVVVAALNSYVQETEGLRNFNEAKSSMINFDSVLRELVFESKEASRTIDFNLKDGLMTIDGDKNEIRTEIDAEIVDKGAKLKEGNVIIKRGPFVDAYEGDPDDNTLIDFVMENDAILFAIRKTGNETNPVSINLNEIIFAVDKFANTPLAPAFSIFIDANDVSSGTGYTTLIERGSDLNEARIKLVMDSVIDYEAIFTLKAGKDYVEVEINPLE